MSETSDGNLKERFTEELFSAGTDVQYLIPMRLEELQLGTEKKMLKIATEELQLRPSEILQQDMIL